MPRLPFYNQDPYAGRPEFGQGGLGQFGAGTKAIGQSGGQALGDARGAQQQALGMYQDMAAGNGPSVAQTQMQQGQDQAIANQIAMQAQGRSGNLGAQMQSAQAAGAGMAMAGNQQAAMLRAQEQQQAMAGAAGLSTEMAGQGLQQQLAAQGMLGDAYGQQMQNQTQWGLGQRELDLQQRAGNRKFALDTSFGIVDRVFSDMRVKEGIEPTAPRMSYGGGGLAGMGMGMRGGQRPGGMLGLAMLSDARAKAAMQPTGGRPRAIDPFVGEPITRGNVDLYGQPEVRNRDGSVSTVDSRSYSIDGREVLLPSVTPDGRRLRTDDEIVREYERTGRHLGIFDTPQNANIGAQRLHEDYARGRYESRTIDPQQAKTASEALLKSEPATYEYREGFGQPGRRAGVMAQGLERTDIGRTIVQDTPRGKAVDVGGLASLTAAATAEQEARLRGVEETLRRPGATVSDAQGRTFATEPSPIEQRFAEQDALRRRIAEEEAILMARQDRGEDVSANLARLQDLATFVDPSIGEAPAREPQRGLGLGQRMQAAPALMQPSDDFQRYTDEERVIMRANEDMMRRARGLADRYGPIVTGRGMQI